MQYEFSGMAGQGVLRGTVYEEYLPFDEGLAVATGTAATLYTAMHDDETKAIGGDVMNSSMETATAGAATLGVFAICPAAAEVMTAMAIPLATCYREWYRT